MPGDLLLCEICQETITTAEVAEPHPDGFAHEACDVFWVCQLCDESSPRHCPLCGHCPGSHDESCGW